MGVSFSALSVATLVWEAGERKTNPTLGGHPSVGVKSGGGGGEGGDPPFSDDDPERTRKETASQAQHKVSNQA